jgi:hypothetical protein
MKRASLNVVPPTAKTETTDLTDRLLAGEARPAAAGTKPKRRAAKRAPAAPAPEQARAATEPEPPTRVLETSDPLADALRQAQQAAEALDQAARQAPARYQLGVRVRLDALAHHVRQVAAFVAARSEP